MVTLGALLVIALMAAIGYQRGVARLGAAFLVLLLSSLLARPLAPLTGWLVTMGGVPKLLVPPLATVASGTLLFVVLLIPTMLWVKAKLAQHSERPAWDGALGALAGSIWGLTLVLLTLVGLSTVARLDRAMRVGTAESAIRAEARRDFERQAEQELRPLRHSMSSQRLASEREKLIAQAEADFYLDPAELRKRTAESPLDGFLVELEHSPFQGTVDAVSPVSVNTEKILRDLTIVMGDPVLAARFRLHPTVRELMSDPTVQTLADDQQIADLVVRGDYHALLDHPKLIEAVQNEQVRARFGKVDMGAILENVRGQAGPVPKG
jgi:hypothetical protein